jgi:hypothetical protein
MRAVFPKSRLGAAYSDLPISLGLLPLPALPMEGRSSGQSEGLENGPRKLRPSPQAGVLQDIRAGPTREVGRLWQVVDRVRGIYCPVGSQKASPRVRQSWHMDRLVGPPAERFLNPEAWRSSACVCLSVPQFPAHPSAIFSPSYYIYRDSIGKPREAATSWVVIDLAETWRDFME